MINVEIWFVSLNPITGFNQCCVLSGVANLRAKHIDVSPKHVSKPLLAQDVPEEVELLVASSIAVICNAILPEKF